ncbi:hypothetical protein WR25_10098 [Diploscapter pachys]|uniref:Uncharacterized protein n=1 Tax=Diploscapter pachys TaxID=2018661 RepID=A0A2A2JIL0_9BILA|nr:hypothetical protein WR25_10098 [Diploscapter pachys]
MSSYGMTEKARLLNQSPDGQQQSGGVSGGQYYRQPIQPQNYVHMEWFNHNDDKYKCCCSSAHVTNGAMSFGVLYLIAALLNLFKLAGYIQPDDRFSNSGYVLPTSTMESCLSEILACICILLVGICTQKSHLLIPFLVLLGVHMLCTFVSLLVILFQADSMDGMNSAQFMNLHAIMTVVYITALAIEVWAFNVVYGCLKYFSDMKKVSYCTPVNNPV